MVTPMDADEPTEKELLAHILDLLADTHGWVRLMCWIMFGCLMLALAGAFLSAL